MNHNSKDITAQVERSLARQKAVIEQAATPEAEAHCLGQGGSNFRALAAKTRDTMRTMEMARSMGQNQAADHALVQERALRLGAGDKGSNGASDIRR
jgi:hypothetical protein